MLRLRKKNKMDNIGIAHKKSLQILSFSYMCVCVCELNETKGICNNHQRVHLSAIHLKKKCVHVKCRRVNWTTGVITSINHNMICSLQLRNFFPPTIARISQYNLSAGDVLNINFEQRIFM